MEKEYYGLQGKESTAMNYRTPMDEPVREGEIPRELERLAKALSELDATCSSLEEHFVSVLRPEIPLKGQDPAINPSCSTSVGISIIQARWHIEGITERVRNIIERKEI